MPESRELLWEVGCEELPAWACDAIERQLPELVGAALVDSGLLESAPDVRVLVGPRRFAALVAGVPAERPASEETLTGPPIKIAFEGGDPAAAPTKAAEGFARKCGVDVGALELDTERGLVQAVKRTPAASFGELWPGLADRIIAGLKFAKPMRWGTHERRFVRPIRWMVTLLGDEAVEYDCWGVRSGAVTRTHRFLGDQREAALADASSYGESLERLHVVVDQAERRARIERGLLEAAEAFGGRWDDPADVLDEVVHLVEQPTVLTGRFSERYLELPERVLVTAMQSHQRYLPVRTEDGLAPAFLTVMNGDPAATDTILTGYERVIAGRLDDAVFSFERDRGRGLDDMAGDHSLGAVAFHARAGSLADRRDRIMAVADDLARQCDVDEQRVADAARLAKADQVSTVVQEFAELEGFAGSLYADAAEYPDDVVAAIDQQFRPRSATAELPDAGVPAIVALADKLELLVTMFAIGEVPTGSRDPFGLRRAAIGVVRIVLEHDLPVELDASLATAGAAVAAQGHGQPTTDDLDQVRTFILDRVEKRLVDDGVRVQAVRAARAAGLPRIQHVDGLARAIHERLAAGDEDFAKVLEAHERCRKILEQAGGAPGGEVDASLLREDSERVLAEALAPTRDKVLTAVDERRFGDAVAAAASLGPAVDAFFAKETGVMVMADDDGLRANRLRLVAGVLAAAAPLGALHELA